MGGAKDHQMGLGSLIESRRQFRLLSRSQVADDVEIQIEPFHVVIQCWDDKVNVVFMLAWRDGAVAQRWPSSALRVRHSAAAVLLVGATCCGIPNPAAIQGPLRPIRLLISISARVGALSLQVGHLQVRRTSRECRQCAELRRCSCAFSDLHRRGLGTT